jgi:hypothetical protein
MAQNSSGRPEGEGPLVEQHVADNYDRLYQEGREYSSMADTAEKMGDRTLAAHLRSRDSDSKRDKAPSGRRSASQQKGVTSD